MEGNYIVIRHFNPLLAHFSCGVHVHLLCTCILTATSCMFNILNIIWDTIQLHTHMHSFCSTLGCKSTLGCWSYSVSQSHFKLWFSFAASTGTRFWVCPCSSSSTILYSTSYSTTDSGSDVQFGSHLEMSKIFHIIGENHAWLGGQNLITRVQQKFSLAIYMQHHNKINACAAVYTNIQYSKSKFHTVG